MAFTPFIETDNPTMEAFNKKFQEAIAEAKSGALADGVKIAIGSYTGTGTYGSSNPNSLTFDFVPKIVIVQGRSYGSGEESLGAVFVMINGVKTVYVSAGGLGSGSYLYTFSEKITWDDKTVKWYALSRPTSYSTYQFNDSGQVYYYIAIG